MSAGDITSEAQNNNGKLMKQLDNYIIVDVGANLTNKKFSRDLDAVIQRAKDAGITILFINILMKMLLYLKLSSGSNIILSF